jgi:plasmid stabilization system protein ParE
VVAGPYQIVWTRRSQQQIRHAYEHISKESLQTASKVMEAIVIAVNKAAGNPAYYNPDKCKKNNDGSYRAFEKHRYRVSYRFTGNVIRVLRVRHTSMEPKKY